MSNTESKPVAGWYPSTVLPGQEMYWTGVEWQTDMIRPLPPTDAPPQTRRDMRTSHGPMNNRSLNVNREVVYTRQQKGHSLTLHLLFGIVVLWINVIYISASPNHHWHI